MTESFHSTVHRPDPSGHTASSGFSTVSQPPTTTTKPQQLRDNASSAAENHLQEEAKRLLGPFGFTDVQKREMWVAFQANPEGVERCALTAKAFSQRQGRNGGGLLLTMVRRGDHLLEAKPETKMPTGWRWVRGESGAAGTFVEDPEGTDRLPPGYDFTPSPTYGGASVAVPEPDFALSDEVRVQLRRLGVEVTQP
jgi:hypothetical protein